MRRSLFVPFGLIVILLLIQGLTLHVFGQPLICPCGTIKLWEGSVAHSSLDITDWYTFSHIIHGFIFYALLTYFFPRLTFIQRLALAVGIEVGWEICENLPAVIQHYRQQALAAGYTGDSILNSLSDTTAMMSGFFFASIAPVWATVTAALGFEFFVGYSIRDNLTLNVIDLLHHFDFIDKWQSGQ